MNPAPLLFLVDDDPAVRGALKFSLELEGFAVRAFDSGEALVGARELETPSCLLLDYRLPGIDGLSLLQQLRAKGQNCPAILITSNPPRRVRQRVRDAGATLVEKPLLGNCLTSAIRALVAAAPTASAA